MSKQLHQNEVNSPHQVPVDDRPPPQPVQPTAAASVPQTLEELNSSLRPLLLGHVDCSIEQLLEQAAGTHTGPVGGCIQSRADQWDEAFPGRTPGQPSSVAKVARYGAKLRSVRKLGEDSHMTSIGHFPQSAPSDPDQAAVLNEAISLMFAQHVIEPIPITETTPTNAQPPVYHQLFLREKKRASLPHNGSMVTAVSLCDQIAIRQILKAWRVIVNYKLGINRYGLAKRFQGTTARHAVQMLRRNDFMIYVDIEEAYYNVPLHEHYRSLCSFWLDLPILRRLAPRGVRLRTLSFGLWSAPRDFVKQLKAALALCRRCGIRLNDLVDDVLVYAPTAMWALRHGMVLLITLRYLGWRVKMEKLALIPAQVREYGGLILATTGAVTVDAPAAKWSSQLDALRALRAAARSSGRASMRMIAQAYGICMSNSSVVYACRVWCVQTGAHYARLQSVLSPWDHQQPCPTAVTDEWGRWLHPMFNKWRGSTICLTPPTLLIAGDASGLGIGGQGLLSTHEPKARLARAQLPPDPRCPPVSAIHPMWFNGVRIRNQHSSITELFGSLFLMATFIIRNNTQNAHVKYLGDNTVTKAYINRLGGRLLVHCTILEPFLHLFRLRNIHVSMGCRSGLTMVRWGIDDLSRNEVSDAELEITDSAWKTLLPTLLPTPTLDVSAGLHNRRLPQFWARYPSMEATAADAMTQSWDRLPLASWVFPPPLMISSALTKMTETTVEATVHFFIPAWTTCTWWPVLLNMLVATPALVPATSTNLARPYCESSGSKNNRFVTKGFIMLAASLSRSVSRQEAFRRQLSTQYTVDGRQQLLKDMTACFPDLRPTCTAKHAVSSSLLTFMLPSS